MDDAFSAGGKKAADVVENAAQKLDDAADTVIAGIGDITHGKTGLVDDGLKAGDDLFDKPVDNLFGKQTDDLFDKPADGLFDNHVDDLFGGQTDDLFGNSIDDFSSHVDDFGGGFDDFGIM